MFEFSRIRADSQALAASTTTRARTCVSRPLSLSMYATPVARPFASVVTTRAIAFSMSVRRPVFIAGGSSTEGDEKLACMLHPLRLHWPQ